MESPSGTLPEPAKETPLDALKLALAARFEAVPYDRGVVVDSSRLPLLLHHLHADAGFNYLRDITAVDWVNGRGYAAPTTRRFDLIYQLTSLRSNLTLSVKTWLDDGESVPSAVPLWPSAGVLEREVWDLMGIRFTGHPDLRRILLSDDWEGHPLRKDYPVTGYDMWNWEAHR